MKRQRGRNRNTTKPSGQQSNNPNRAYESSGPEGAKVRGNAQTIYEKYQQLTRDANSSGDRVLAENYLQHAEHYFRLIRQMQPTRPVSEFVARDPFSNFYDIEDDADGYNDTDAQAETSDVEGDDSVESAADNDFRARDRNDRSRDRNDRNRNDRNRDNRERDNRERGERFDNRPENRENRTEVRADNRPENRPDNRTETRNDPRPERIELDENGNRRETRRERYERRRSQRLNEQQETAVAVISNDPLGAPVLASTEPLIAKSLAPQSDLEFKPELEFVAAPNPKAPRTTRPKAVEAEAVDHTHLPAFLRAPAPVKETPETEAPSDVEDAPKKPRARRKKAETTTEEA